MRVVLDRVETGEMFYCLACVSRAGCGIDVEEFAPDVRTADDLANLLAAEPVKSGRAVGVQITSEQAKYLAGRSALRSGA